MPKPPGQSFFSAPATLILCGLTLAMAAMQSVWGVDRIAGATGVVIGNLSRPSMLAKVSAGQILPGFLTLFSYLFPHGGWWHVLPNMTALWIFGAIAEDAAGSRRFAAGYFISGAVGAYCYALVVPVSPKPLAGSSLAIAGLAGAYAAWRWSGRPHSKSREYSVLALEAAAVAGVAIWLTIRTVPVAPNLSSSLMYHFIPLLVMWLGVRVWSGLARSL